MKSAHINSLRYASWLKNSNFSCQSLFYKVCVDLRVLKFGAKAEMMQLFIATVTSKNLIATAQRHAVRMAARAEK